MNQSKRDNYNKRLIHALLVNIYKQLLSNFKQKSNKRHLRADGLSLLPSALRPRLLGGQIGTILAANKANLGKYFSLLRTLNSSKAASISILAVFSLAFSLFIQNSYVSNVSAASLTLSIPSTPLSLDISPLKETNFKKSTAGQISVTTDSASGYTLSIKSKNADNYDKLINGANFLNSIDNALSETDYQNSGSLNTWAWLPSKLNGELNSNFQPSPKNSEETIIETTEESNETANNYDITLAAKTDQTITTGSYTNTFVITSIANPPKIAGIMQEWNYDDCNALGEEEVVILEDSRDGNTYKVAKLKDGKCWMVENLRIGGEQPIAMTPADSDVSNSNFTLPASSTSGFSSYDVANVYVPTQDSGNVKKEYGGYYTWYAATAGTGSRSMSYGQEVSSSICPKGWRLPKGDSNGEFQALYDQYNSADLMLNGAPHFLLAGGYRSSSPHDQGSYGYYWSSTTYGYDLGFGGYGAWYLYLNSSSVTPDYYDDQHDGVSVRCVAKEPKKITDLQYLQDWSDLSSDEKTQVLNSMEDETNYTLTDKRDNTQYTVAKLKDGKLWMTQNLKIAGKNISSTDSDMESGSFSIPAATAASTFNTSYTNVNNSRAYVDSYGGLYTWYTATAGTGNSSITSGNVNATSSICPKGWKLPTGGSSSDYNNLVTAYGGNNSTGSTNLRHTPVPGFTYAGYINFDNGSLPGQGSVGLYWSSTSRDSTYAYNLSPASSRADPAFNYYRVSGLSVRCLARE